MVGKTLKFDDGAAMFRQRLAVSLLSHRPLLLRNIRSEDLEAPGLRPYEASFLRLLDNMTNGTVIEINATGTQLRFRPGVLLGGDIEHACPIDNLEEDSRGVTNTGRGIGWFLEGVLPLAPFGKEALHLTLTGSTDGTVDVDPSPDYLKAAILPLLTLFGIGAESDESSPPTIRVVTRGAAPKGGGVVEFYCPLVKELQSIDFLDTGKFKRVRGNAISCKVSPSASARVAHAAKGLLQRLLPDVWIHTDVHSTKRDGCGPSPALAVVMWAESTTGVVMCSEACLDPNQPRGSELPEDLGVRGAAMLLEEVRRGGCVDTSAQALALLWMCLGPEDVARIRLGTLSQHAISSLRLYKEAFDVEFKVKPDHATKTVLMICLGTGFRNMAKAST